MIAWIEVQTDRKRIAQRVLDASWGRTRAMQERENGEAMRTDTTGMSGDELKYHELRKKHCMQDILREEGRREALKEAEAANARATADAADAAARAAARRCIN